MSLQEIRDAAMPLARRIVRMRHEMQQLQRELTQMLNATDAHLGYRSALLFFAEYEIDNLTPVSAAEFIAINLGLTHVLLSPAAQAMTPERQMELMLQGRFEAAVKGN